MADNRRADKTRTGAKPSPAPALLALGLFLVLGLALVWINVNRTHMAYELRRMEAELEDAQAHLAKLEVERDNLLSPARLRRLARERGLRRAEPGQIRSIAQGEGDS